MKGRESPLQIMFMLNFRWLHGLVTASTCPLSSAFNNNSLDTDCVYNRHHHQWYLISGSHPDIVDYVISQ